MTAVVVAVGALALSVVAATCFRWWLDFRASQALAEREARLAEARAAPQEVAALRAEVSELKVRISTGAFR